MEIDIQKYTSIRLINVKQQYGGSEEIFAFIVVVR
jgi:hypothetical protein